MAQDPDFTTATPSKPNRKGLYRIWFFAAMVLLGYGIYWTIVATKIEQTIHAGLDQRADITVQQVQVRGFPYRHTLRLRGVAFERADGTAFGAVDVAFTASALNPFLWGLDHIEGANMRWGHGTARTVDLSHVRASVHIGKDGLKRLSIDAKDVIGAPNSAVAGDTGWRLSQGALHIIAAQRGGPNAGQHGLALELRGLNLPTGAKIGPVSANIDEFVLRGPISHVAALGHSGRAWAKAGGQFRIMYGKVRMGDIAVDNLRGQLALKDDGTWQGRIDMPATPVSDAASLQIVDGTLRLGPIAVPLPRAF